jgi:hypothetical protein
MMPKELLSVPRNGAVQVLFETSLCSHARTCIFLSQQEGLPSIEYKKQKQKPKDESTLQDHELEEGRGV